MQPSPDHAECIRLTARQARVLLLICEGHSYKLLAFRLGISLGTVKAHVRTLSMTLNLSGRPELTAWAMQHPGALSTQLCERRMHRAGCLCGSVYCEAMRTANKVAA